MSVHGSSLGSTDVPSLKLSNTAPSMTGRKRKSSLELPSDSGNPKSSKIHAKNPKPEIQIFGLGFGMGFWAI